MTTHAGIDHDRVTAAIRAAEANTSGEIYCVLARRSDNYFHPAAFSLAVSLLLVSALAAFALESLWIGIRPLVLAGIQILAFAAAVGVVSLWPSLRIRLVSKRMRYRRAHENAVRQFLARNIHLTRARTGVLVFVSLAERYAEIVADEGIDAKVPQEAWNGIVARLLEDARAGRLTEGYEMAIAAVGALLAEHFPRRADDDNELDDHLVEI